MGKSIRDRVALIKWRRERTAPRASQGAAAPAVPVPILCEPAGPVEPDEPEVDQHVCPLSARTTSTTCKRWMSHLYPVRVIWLSVVLSPCLPPCLPLADSGIGSTVYSDSHGSGLHSVIHQPLQDSVCTATQEVRITNPSEDDVLFAFLCMHVCTCIDFIQRNYTKCRP